MKKSLLLLGLVAAFAAQAEFVRGWLTTTLPTGEETVEVEAEWFEDYGGWVNNTQFMDQMGSSPTLRRRSSRTAESTMSG